MEVWSEVHDMKSVHAISHASLIAAITAMSFPASCEMRRNKQSELDVSVNCTSFKSNLHSASGHPLRVFVNHLPTTCRSDYSGYIASDTITGLTILAGVVRGAGR